MHCLFFQPLTPDFDLLEPKSEEFSHKLDKQKVILEEIKIVNNFTVRGKILAKSFDTDLQMASILYTFNNFRSFTKTPANKVHQDYNPHSPDLDLYTFKVKVTDYMSKLQFVIMYRAGDNQYTDDNNGQLYTIFNPNNDTDTSESEDDYLGY